MVWELLKVTTDHGGSVVIVFYFPHEIKTDLKNGTHCLRLQLTVVHEEFQVFVEQDLEQEEVSEIYLSWLWCGRQ